MLQLLAEVGSLVQRAACGTQLPACHIERGQLPAPGVEPEDIDAHIPVSAVHGIEDRGLAGTSRAHNSCRERHRRIGHDLGEQGASARVGLEHKFTPSV
ncbi:MAG: hypothetical protein M3308_05195 [Actinomycetota bacterium]|nr:hypothetical protein [Actinomycetota bacterium]